MRITNDEKVVFINEKVFVIRNGPLYDTVDLAVFKRSKEDGVIVRGSVSNLAKYLRDLTLGEQTCAANFVILSVHSIPAFFSELRKEFKVIQAGGGIVNSEKGLLLINRLGKWDLPKGKLEKGERIEACAEREVEEECNVKVQINKFETHSYHTYVLKGKAVLKETFWYQMDAVSTNELVPQKEEGIDEVIWANKADVTSVMTNTYASIAWVLGKLVL